MSVKSIKIVNNNGKVNVTTEGYTPEEHGVIESFINSKFFPNAKTLVNGVTEEVVEVPFILNTEDGTVTEILEVPVNLIKEFWNNNSKNFAHWVFFKFNETHKRNKVISFRPCDDFLKHAGVYTPIYNTIMTDEDSKPECNCPTDACRVDNFGGNLISRIKSILEDECESDDDADDEEPECCENTKGCACGTSCSCDNNKDSVEPTVDNITSVLAALAYPYLVSDMLLKRRVPSPFSLFSPTMFTDRKTLAEMVRNTGKLDKLNQLFKELFD